MGEYDRDGPAHRRAMAAAGRLRRMSARVIIDDADSRRMAKTLPSQCQFQAFDAIHPHLKPRLTCVGERLARPDA